MITWMKDNLASVALWTTAVVLLVAMSSAGGCSLRDLISVRVPPEIRQETGIVTPTVTLDDAYVVREVYLTKSRLMLEQFDEAIADGENWASWFAFAMNTGLTSLQTSSSLAAVPGGGLIVTFLGMLGTLMVNKPGTASRFAKARENALNEGEEKARKLLANGNGVA